MYVPERVWACVAVPFRPLQDIKLSSFQRTSLGVNLFLNAVALAPREHLSSTSVTDIECTVHTLLFFVQIFLDDFFNNSLYQKGCELVAVTIL